MNIIKNKKTTWPKRVTCGRCNSILDLVMGDIKTSHINHSSTTEDGLYCQNILIETDYYICEACRTKNILWQGEKDLSYNRLSGGGGYDSPYGRITG